MAITITKLIIYLIYSIGLSMVAYGMAWLVKEKKLTNKKSKMAELAMKRPWVYTLVLLALFILFDLFNI